MGVNPPKPENFINPDTGETAVSPAAVNLGDVDAVRLEAYRAKVEKRKPNFKGFPENAVRAAGYTVKGKEIERPVGAPHVTLTEQTPILNESTQPNTAPVEADPAKKGLAQAQIGEKATKKTEAAKKVAESIPVKKAATPTKKAASPRAKKAAAARKKS